MYWGHDLDISGSRDVTSSVTWPFDFPIGGSLEASLYL